MKKNLPARQAGEDASLTRQTSEENAVAFIITAAVEKEAAASRNRFATKVTPKDAIKKLPGGTSEDGKELEYDYVQVAYMLEEIQREWEFIEFVCIDKPHTESFIMPARTLVPKEKISGGPVPVTLPGGEATFPAFMCLYEVIVRKAGLLVKRFPAPGFCAIAISKTNGKWVGVEAAYKGCVTDAMKKGMSFFGIANDVYDYGLISSKVEFADRLFAELEAEYGELATRNKAVILDAISKQIDNVQMMKMFSAFREKFQKAQVRPEQAQSVKPREETPNP